MQIHSVKQGESIDSVAKMYEVDEAATARINEVGDDPLAVGEELLILKPTRTHTAGREDSVERLSLRFGVPTSDIYAYNPWIYTDRMRAGEVITLRQGEKSYGMAVANGIFYRDCTEQRLKAVLPYLTYVTFASACADGDGIKPIFDESGVLDIARRAEKIPLLRVYDNFPERYRNGRGLERFSDGLIRLATEKGYKGIVLCAVGARNMAKEFADFAVGLRRKMIGCDLILITEIDGDSPAELSEYADGSVLSFAKYEKSPSVSFADGEGKVISDFACKGESAKTFIELPVFARVGDEFIGVNDAVRLARQGRCEITENGDTLVSEFTHKRRGEVSLPSLKKIKAVLDLLDEYDFMGICFDIMRVPLRYLMMYNSMFKTAYHTSVRSREGCSHARGE